MAEQNEAKTSATSAGASDATHPAPQSAVQQLLGLAWWKKLLLVLAVLLMGVGLALPFVAPQLAEARQTPAAQTEGGGADLPPGAMQGLAPTDPNAPDGAGANGAAPGEEVNPWSPAIFALGFSFVAGFAIAFAIRSFIKITVIAVGLFLLFLFGLEYAGLVAVNWGAVSQHYDSFSGWLAAETSSFQDFITGRLPSAASAIAGLGLGFTRK